MKKLSILLVTCFAFVANISNAGNKIHFDIKNLDDSVVFIARYYGDNKYIKDTVETGGKEKFSYITEEDLPCGIYMMVREKRNSFVEFVVSEKEFTMISDTTDFVHKTKFKGSPDNELLYQYFVFAGALQKESMQLQKERREIDSLPNKESRKVEISTRLRAIGKELNEYKEQFISNHPSHPMTVVFLMQREIVFPKEIENDTSSLGEQRRYRYFMNQYWASTPFNSKCLIRTPVFHSKMQQYFDKYIPQHFDSAVVYIEDLISKVRNNEEMFKYVVNYVSFKWESGKSKRMCWDKVFYHMATNYYNKGLCPWTDLVKLEKIKSRAKDIKYTLCGNPTPNFKLQDYPKMSLHYDELGLYDTLGVMHDLNKIRADYIILWFWDSDCGHCKSQTPILWDVYQKYKKAGVSVEVFAVNIEQSSEGYKKYLRENKYNWINVQDTLGLSGFRQHYDIYSTPVSYIIDKRRNIIGKRLAPAPLDDFFKQYLKEEEGIIVE